MWTDDDGTVRLLAPGSTFADTVEEAFRQLRQHSQNQPAVLIRLVESLGQLLAQANATQRRVLQKEVEIILETGRRHIAQKEDLKVLESGQDSHWQNRSGPSMSANGTKRTSILRLSISAKWGKTDIANARSKGLLGTPTGHYLRDLRGAANSGVRRPWPKADTSPRD